jgi:hypothetical protein
MSELDERIRRQVYRLTEEDFVDHPIWEFCSDEEGVDGQDEATVKPSTDPEVPGYSPGAYIVAANVSFADGTQTTGYVYSSEPDDFGCLQPNLVLKSGQVNLWLGGLRGAADQDLAQSYLTINKSSNQVFPLSVETRAKINGAAMNLMIEGFVGCDREGQLVTRR